MIRFLRDRWTGFLLRSFLISAAFQLDAAALLAQNSHRVSSADLRMKGMIADNGGNAIEATLSPVSNDRRAILDVLSDLENRFGANFSFDNEMLEGKFVNSKRADEFIRSLSADGKSKFEEGLSALLNSFDMACKAFANGSYAIYPNGKEIPLKKGSNNFNEAADAGLRDLVSDGRTLQEIVVKGQVKSSETGEAMPGVNILVKGTVGGTVTDAEGRYAVSVPGRDAVLVFSFIGFVSHEVAVEGREIIDVSMKEDIRSLEQVVVVGYGTQKKVNLTGAVTQITSDKLESRNVTNIDQALQGIAPGLNITTNANQGGQPNAPMGINIRGVGSLSGGSPYVLVDGSPMELNMVNPADVESISVLKDAASTAIYGSRAAYGVILITTKSGKNNEKIQTTYNNSFIMSQPTYLPGFVNSLDFANTINEAANNSGQNNIFSDETLERIRQYQADPNSMPSMVADPKDPNGWGYWNQGHANTDWYDVLYKDWSFAQRHNLGVNGGSKNANYYLGLGWVGEDGKLNFAGERYERFNLTSNLSLQVSEKIKVHLKAKFARGYQKYFVSQSVDDRESFFSSMGISWPTDPVYTPNGDFALDKNQPPVLKHGGSDKQYTSDIWLSPSLEIALNEAWKVNADLSYNFNGYKRGHHRAAIWGLSTDGVTPIRHYSQNWSRMSQVLTHNEYFTANVYSSFSKQINQHHLGLLVGAQSEFSNNMLLSGWRRDLVTEGVPSISTAIGDKETDDAMAHWSTLGTFMRVSYNFNEKYLVELNGRYDGSSRFQRGRRWGFFPSASVGYNISQEDFWRPLENTVTNFKIRASYGSLGNQNVANYLHEETIPIYTNLAWIMDGKRPVYSGIPSNRSTGLTWETSKTVNLGFDADLFNGKLNATFDWFKRSTENMFGPGQTLPALYGAAVPLKNNATLETKGVELSVNWRQVVSEDLKFDVGVIYSDNKSVVTEYNNPTRYIHDFYPGKTYGEIWGLVSEGLFQSDAEATEWVDQSQYYSRWGAGDVKYSDLNDDGKITTGNQTLANPGDLKVIGNTQPRHLFGLTTNVNFKAFDFTMFWQGVGQRDVWMPNQNFFGFRSSWTATTVAAHAMDYWNPGNTDAYFARPYLTAENNKNQQLQTRYLQDASYIRLKNLQVGYTLPGRWSSKIRLERLRVYVGGENLLTSSDMIAFDPEANVRASGANLVYPLSRSFNTGLSLTF
jgi:TonB-linked SusC/RagA family outer membrane protein